MKKTILLTAIFAVMCVATSYGLNIALSGTDNTKNQIIADFITTNIPGTVVTQGDYSNPANIPAGTEILVIGRALYSGAYDNATNSATFNALPIPIVCLTSFVCRTSGNRWSWHSGGTAGASAAGNESTVLAAGSAAFGVAPGTYDFWAGGLNGNAFNAAGSGTVGGGEILATIGGNILAARWHTGDLTAGGAVCGGERLLFNIPDTDYASTPWMPDTDAGRTAFFRVLRSLISRPEAPYDPVVTPADVDGKVGTLVQTSVDPAPKTYQVQDVVLSFKAGHDPEGVEPFNPAIVLHNIYLQTGAPTDPNFYLYDAVEQVSLTDPSISYGPLPNDLLKQGTVYNWKVEEVINDPNGNPYPAGNTNNIMGDVWNFTTTSATPVITASPVHTLTDSSGSATLSIEVGAVADYWRWYKEAGETDVKLTNATIAGVTYSGTQTKTLTITGMAADGSEDAQYYAIAYNGFPEGGLAVASAPSNTVWVWYPRLVNHYAMESMTYVVDPNGITPDAISGFNLRMASNDSGTDVPVLDPNVAAGITGTTSLKFDNPRGTDPNSADAQYAQIDAGWAGGYADITISMWVYSNGGTNWNRILDFGNDNANYMFVCLNPGSVNGALRFAVNVGGTEQSVTSAAEALPDHEWTCVTATLSGNTGRIYINGELDGTNTGLTNDPVSYGPTTQNWLGRSQWGAADGYFNGMIDELKIYNYALTTEQIAQDYLDVRGEWVCNYELNAGTTALPYDFDGNCRIDLIDFATFAETWMETYRIYPD